MLRKHSVQPQKNTLRIHENVPCKVVVAPYCNESLFLFSPIC